MAISRALMNRQLYNMGGPSQPRQMYDMGGSSLQAGAPDLRLTGDVRPTYTQGRKNRMDMAFGGIAGLDGRKKYGIGSWFQENIMDPIKNNPVTSAVIGGGLVNQFGLPDVVTEYLNMGSDVGQNFLGDLVGRDLVLGDGEGFTSGSNLPDLINLPDIFGGGRNSENSNINLANLAQFLPGSQYGSDGSTNSFGNYIQNLTDKQEKAAKFATAIGAGEAARRYVDAQPKDVLATDDTGLDIAGITAGAQAGTDENLRFRPDDATTLSYAQGGRIGYQNGMNVDPMTPDIDPSDIDALVESYMKSPEGEQELTNQTNQGMSMSKIVGEMKQELMMAQASSQGNMQMQQPQMAAMGGRIGYDTGGPAIDPEYNGWKKIYEVNPGVAEMHENHQQYLQRLQSEQTPVKKAEGGLMNLGGNEMDLRAEGGFIPIGGKEKADDVPARLSKNEFVFTADAVRNAGGGDIDEGAQVMERLMKSLEQGGEVSEESQGLDGAREMFETSQRLEKRII